MKDMIKFILFLLAALAGVAGGSVYIKNKKGYRINDSDVQYLACLKLEEVLNWVERKLLNESACTLRILPNEATLKAFTGRLNLNENDLKKCIYIIVIDNSTNEIILRKLVIPQSISPELSVLNHGEMYTVPIE